MIYCGIPASSDIYKRILRLDKRLFPDDKPPKLTRNSVVYAVVDADLVRAYMIIDHDKGAGFVSRIGTDPKQKKRGLASLLLRQIHMPLTTYIVKNNIASLNLFTRNGFKFYWYDGRRFLHLRRD